MHDRLVSRRIDALHQCFLVNVCCMVWQKTPGKIGFLGPRGRFVHLGYLFNLCHYYYYYFYYWPTCLQSTLVLLFRSLVRLFLIVLDTLGIFDILRECFHYSCINNFGFIPLTIGSVYITTVIKSIPFHQLRFRMSPLVNTVPRRRIFCVQFNRRQALRFCSTITDCTKEHNLCKSFFFLICLLKYGHCQAKWSLRTLAFHVVLLIVFVLTEGTQEMPQSRGKTFPRHQKNEERLGAHDCKITPHMKPPMHEQGNHFEQIFVILSCIRIEGEVAIR